MGIVAPRAGGVCEPALPAPMPPAQIARHKITAFSLLRSCITVRAQLEHTAVDQLLEFVVRHAVLLFPLPVGFARRVMRIIIALEAVLFVAHLTFPLPCLVWQASITWNDNPVLTIRSEAPIEVFVVLQSTLEAELVILAKQFRRQDDL